jgi:molecular chaperone DnaK
MANYNKLLGEFNLEGIPPARRGVPQIEVTFDIDANGILSVKAADKGTGKENKITIKANSGLSEAEIQAMIKDAELNAEADKKARELIDRKNSAESLINDVEGKLEKHGDQLSPEEKSAVEESVAELKEAVKGTDADAISAKLENMFKAFGPLNDKVMAAESQPTPQPATESTDPDAPVDVEAKEVKPGA